MKRIDMEKNGGPRKKHKMKRGLLASNRLNKMYNPEYLRSRIKMGVMTPKKTTQPEGYHDHMNTSRHHTRKINKIIEKIAPWEKELPEDHQPGIEDAYDPDDAIFKETMGKTSLQKGVPKDNQPTYEDLLDSLDKEHATFMAIIGKIGPQESVLENNQPGINDMYNFEKKTNTPLKMMIGKTGLQESASEDCNGEASHNEGTRETRHNTNEMPIFEIDPGYKLGSAKFDPKITPDNQIDPRYIDGSAIFKPRYITKNKGEWDIVKHCKNGIKNCPYIVCEVKNGTPRPIYSFPKMTSCGKSHATEFCTHEFCHDDRLKLAAGDSYALKAQLNLNKTGIYKHVPPINYKMEGERVVITKEATRKHINIEIANINWNKEEALLYLTEGGETSGLKPFRRVKINTKKYGNPTTIGTEEPTTNKKIEMNEKSEKKEKDRTRTKTPKAGNILYTLFMMFLVFGLTFTYSMAEEIQTPNFIYESVHDDLILNSRYLYSGTRWVPCDLLGAKATMMDLLAAEEEICNTEFMWDPMENNKLIRETDEHFTLLHGLHNAKSAEKLCQSIGADVVEIGNTSSTKPLQRFMGRHLVKATWAGIEFDNNLDEMTFKSDKRMATFQGFKTINYFHKGEKNTMSWANALYYHRKRSTYLNHGNFVYKNNGKNIELWLRHEGSPYRKPNSESEPWRYGAVSVLPVICEREMKNTNAQDNHRNWKTSCKHHLKVMKEKVNVANHKISQVMPEALPSTLETLTPFLYMDNLDGKKNMTTIKETNAQPDLRLDAQTSWNTLLEQEKQSTVTQCWEHQDDRHKRFPFVAVGAVISTVFSATEFFVRMLPILKQKITEAKGEEENQPEGILYALKDISTNTNQMMAVYRMINTHSNLTYILSNQDEIRDSLTTIIEYVDQVYNKITALVYVDHYKPKSAMEFMTKTRFDQIINYVRTKFNENLLDDISKTVTYIGNSGSSFLIATAIPFLELPTMTKLFRIHKMPKIVNGYQIFPTTEAEYMAVEKHDNAFTPISSTQAIECMQKGHCSSSQSTFKSGANICGYSNFWGNDGRCDFTRTKIKRPYFTVIGNKTYFSVGKMPINITITCTSKIYNKPGKQRVERISNTGVFELEDSCSAESGFQKMRPSQRNLEMPSIGYKKSEFRISQVEPQQQVKYLEEHEKKYKNNDIRQSTKGIHMAQTLIIIALIIAVFFIMASAICLGYQTKGYIATVLGCLPRQRRTDTETGQNQDKHEDNPAISYIGTQDTQKEPPKSNRHPKPTNNQAGNGKP